MRIILTGATGMVGEGVLHECLLHPDVNQVLVINRKPCGVVHPKLKEVIHADFLNLAAVTPQLANLDACFFCAGVSSIGMKEAAYHKLTYDLTVHVAETLAKLNPGMTFCYVSGAGTDSTEKGKSMWARVKGKTENKLLGLPFKRVYMFRPALMKATKGAKNTPKIYTALGWTYPIIKTLFPKSACTLKEVGLAMINCAQRGYPKPVLEVSDIMAQAKAKG